MCAEHDPPRPSYYENFARSKDPLPVKLLQVSLNLLRRGFPRPAACCGHYGEPGC